MFIFQRKTKGGGRGEKVAQNRIFILRLLSKMNDENSIQFKFDKINAFFARAEKKGGEAGGGKKMMKITRDGKWRTGFFFKHYTLFSPH